MSEIHPSFELQLVQAGAVAKLDPQEVSAGAQQVALQLSRDAQAWNTVRAQQSVIAYWVAWFSLRYGRKLELPVPVAAVIQFVTDHAMVRKSAESEEFVLGMGNEADGALVAAKVKRELGALALATIEHRVAVLSMIHGKFLASLQHADAGAAIGNPCLDPRVRAVLKDLRRSYAQRGAAAPKKKPPLTKDLLKLVLDTCDNSLIGIRDRAILAVAFASGGRRRSELAGMQLEFLRPTKKGFVYYLGHTKTNQAGDDDPTNWKPIQETASLALEAWLEAMKSQEINVREGPLFRKVFKGTSIGPTALGTSMIWRIVKDRCEKAGLDESFSPHSLRSGFLTQAGKDGIAVHEAMAMSGHSDIKVAMGYTHVGALENLRGARLLDDGPESEDTPG